MAVQAGLCQTWSEIPKMGFLVSWLIVYLKGGVQEFMIGCFVAAAHLFLCAVTEHTKLSIFLTADLSL